MSSEPIKIEITQELIDDAASSISGDQKYLYPSSIIGSSYVWSNYYEYEIVEDIIIHENIILCGFKNVKVINRTITNAGKISGCSNWTIINSEIKNNIIESNCGDWVLLKSKITKIDSKPTNAMIQNHCYDWKIVCSNITNHTIENCTNFIIIGSKLIECSFAIDNNFYTWITYLNDDELLLVKKEDYNKLQNNSVNNSVGNVMSPINENTNTINNIIKDDKLSKLLLYMYLKEKDNGRLIRKLK